MNSPRSAPRSSPLNARNECSASPIEKGDAIGCSTFEQLARPIASSRTSTRMFWALTPNRPHQGGIASSIDLSEQARQTPWGIADQVLAHLSAWRRDDRTGK